MLTNALMFSRVVLIWLVRIRLDLIPALVAKDTVWTKRTKPAQVIRTHKDNFQESKTANDRGLSYTITNKKTKGLLSNHPEYYGKNQLHINFVVNKTPELSCSKGG